MATKQRQSIVFFDRIPNTRSVYIKDYATSEGIFTVALIFSDDPYTTLPYAQVLKKPEKKSNTFFYHTLAVVDIFVMSRKKKLTGILIT